MEETYKEKLYPLTCKLSNNVKENIEVNLEKLSIFYKYFFEFFKYHDWKVSQPDTPYNYNRFDVCFKVVSPENKEYEISIFSSLSLKYSKFFNIKKIIYSRHFNNNTTRIDKVLFDADEFGRFHDDMLNAIMEEFIRNFTNNCDNILYIKHIQLVSIVN